jgi:hypothetical protein
MQETSARAMLLTAPDAGGQAITTTVSRAEIAAALAETAEAGGRPPDLLLDVTRSLEEGEGAVEHKRVAVAWEAADLERLLGETAGEAVTLAFDRNALEHALEGPDIEAHGLRERAAVLAVAVVTAAGASAGVASASLDVPVVDGASAGAPTSSAYTAFEAARAAQPATAGDRGAIESSRAEAMLAAHGSVEAARADAARAEGVAAATGGEYAAFEASRAVAAASDTVRVAADDGPAVTAPGPETIGIGAALVLAITGAAFALRGRRTPGSGPTPA